MLVARHVANAFASQQSLGGLQPEPTPQCRVNSTKSSYTTASAVRMALVMRVPGNPTSDLTCPAAHTRQLVVFRVTCTVEMNKVFHDPDVVVRGFRDQRRLVHQPGQPLPGGALDW